MSSISCCDVCVARVVSNQFEQLEVCFGLSQMSSLTIIRVLKSSVQSESFHGSNAAGTETDFIPSKLWPSARQTSQETGRNASAAHRG